MGLTKDQVFEIIINEKSREDGGNVAQDGFSYQYACAIKEIIDRYIKNQDFLLIIEKIDDFIIVDDHMVNIFQAKNIKDKSYTVDFLTTNKNGDNSSKKTSILSNIVSNYNQIKKALNNYSNIKSYLVINNENNKISLKIQPDNKKAYKSDDHRDFLNLDLVIQDEKNEMEKIISMTCPFTNIYIKRMLPYKDYEEYVKISINQAINLKYKDPYYNLDAIYDSLRLELEKCRKRFNKLDISYLSEKIDKVIKLDKVSFSNWADVKDFLNSVNIKYDISIVCEHYRLYSKMLNSKCETIPIFKDYTYVKSFCKSLKSVQEIFDDIAKDNKLTLTNRTEEVLAMILLNKGEL